MSRRLRIDLAYDGTDFAGWQVQKGLRTVQGVLEDALRRVHGDRPVRVHAAGRSDAGVHARGQVAHCDVEVATADEDLAHALHRLLPPDVRPLGVGTVEPTFHARHDARWKTYRYRLDLSRYGDPFGLRYALHYPRPLAVEAMRQGMRLLPGRRDWSSFAGAACRVTDRVRKLTCAELEIPRRDVAWLTFTADGFLNYMVRNLVGTLLDIGRGHLPPERISEILASGDRTLAGVTAPPRGLCLERVLYDGDNP